jgi:hypothetical protein
MTPCPACHGTGHSGNLEDELCGECGGGGGQMEADRR